MRYEFGNSYIPADKASGASDAHAQALANAGRNAYKNAQSRSSAANPSNEASGGGTLLLLGAIGAAALFARGYRKKKA
jgi:hypothetical protein